MRSIAIPLLVGLLLAPALTGCSASARTARSVAPSATPARQPAAAPPLGRLPAGVTPTHYGLDLTVLPDAEHLSGVVTIAATLDRAQDLIWMHGVGLEVRTATVTTSAGARVGARWQSVDPSGVASLRLDRAVGPGQVEIRIDYRTPFRRPGLGPFRVVREGQAYAYTQFEPDWARRAYPCFDEPRFRTPFDVTLTVRDAHVAIGNMEIATQAALPGGLKRVTFATTPAIPSYLVAWAVGPFDVVEAPPIAASDLRDTPLPLRGVAPRGQGGSLALALEQTPRILASLERYFGARYPYSKLDLVVAPELEADAMENPGLLNFQEEFLLLDAGTAAEPQRRSMFMITAHELTHQWMGNLVGIGWWDDMWMKEALAVWSAGRTTEEVHPEYRARAVLLERSNNVMRMDAQPRSRVLRTSVARSAQVIGLFDGFTYGKGPALMLMIESWLGPERFREAMRRFVVERHDAVATTDDLLRVLSESSGTDVAPILASFLDQPGFPRIAARLACDAAGVRLELEQSPHPSSAPANSRIWRIPVCARWGRGGDVQSGCTLLTSRQGALDLGAGACPDWVMPNAGATGYYRWTLPAREWMALLRRGWSALTVRERIQAAGDLEALVETGDVLAEDAAGTLEALARDEERLVATVPMRVIETFLRFLPADASRPQLERLARGLYAPRVRALRWDPAAPIHQGDERVQLHNQILEFLALVGREPSIRREAARRGQRLLAGPVDEVVAPELRTVALSVALQDGGEAVLETVIGRLVATDGAADPLRANLVEALAHAPAAALPRVQALVLDPRLPPEDIWPVLTGLTRGAETREQTWQFIQTSFDALLARLGPGRGGLLLQASQSFCDEAHALEVRAVFEPRAANLPAVRWILPSITEAISRCAARASVQAPGLRRLFASH